MREGKRAERRRLARLRQNDQSAVETQNKVEPLEKVETGLGQIKVETPEQVETKEGLGQVETLNNHIGVETIAKVETVSELIEKVETIEIKKEAEVAFKNQEKKSTEKSESELNNTKTSHELQETKLCFHCPGLKNSIAEKQTEIKDLKRIVQKQNKELAIKYQQEKQLANKTENNKPCQLNHYSLSELFRQAIVQKINEQTQELAKYKQLIANIEGLIRINNQRGRIDLLAEKYKPNEQELLELAKRTRGISPNDPTKWQVVLTESGQAERDRMAEDNPQQKIENLLEDLEKEGLRLIMPTDGEYKAIIIKRSDFNDRFFKSNREALNDFEKACDNFMNSSRGKELEQVHAKRIKKREDGIKEKEKAKPKREKPNRTFFDLEEAISNYWAKYEVETKTW
ncbi:2923_t:CDS:2 [Racocetra persica]|uniref:2923_t:CDS:1 n=1 Tax=Racocetra persica TaxID=160502 RepID=A0ACA9L7H6_9GLOM|nr:2923_t:CDS:2 [Racocetra persica]